MYVAADAKCLTPSTHTCSHSQIHQCHLKRKICIFWHLFCGFIFLFLFVVSGFGRFLFLFFFSALLANTWQTATYVACVQSCAFVECSTHLWIGGEVCDEMAPVGVMIFELILTRLVLNHLTILTKGPFASELPFLDRFRIILYNCSVPIVSSNRYSCMTSFVYGSNFRDNCILKANFKTKYKQ